MYKVIFNTKEFESKKRRSWENQLRNDFAVSINGKEFICKDESELYHRLSFIDNTWDNDSKYGKYPFEYFQTEDNFVILRSPIYYDRKLPLSMYGFALGYVDKEKVINTVNEKGFISIPFSNFYDIRQGNFFKKCYIEIIKEDI